MLKRTYQSPLFNCLLIFCFGLIMIGEHYTAHIPSWLIIDPMVLGIPILIIIAIIPFYNRMNPEDKIKPSVIPMELREEDEGLQWLTFNATRKVYIFYAFAIPFGIALTAYFNDVPYFSIILLAVMGIVQYLIYWLQMKKFQ
ncbi:hypothetical protein FZC84_00315 [Rossellomorea vietnamensis]|uniref:Uncharacterized protein n=1 Tax=Rossellomorea vietnamensis TaxID=218284 RepID=A0A5D4MID2_9BACI|nr:hypothetical protein [Rossellomorea vietnamensis]TYS01149.1 hypothetical protein FZC84_00315 [Rossellomorea vietnamensis]